MGFLSVRSLGGNVSGVRPAAVRLTDDLLARSRFALRRGAGQADATGADELLDAVRADELLERVDVLGQADDLEDQRLGPEVGDASLEDVGEREQLASLVGRGRDLDQRQLALDRLARLELVDAEHVHELVHLLLDLLERMLLAVDAERDPRDVVPLGRPDGEALDVEAAAGEHARDAHQRTRLVLDEDGQRVLHGAVSVSSSGNSTRSSAAAPAGIIGKQCSRGSTRASTTAVRPQESASASTPSRSSSLSTVKPTPP